MRNRASNKILAFALAAAMMLGMFTAAPSMTAYAVDIGTTNDLTPELAERRANPQAADPATALSSPMLTQSTIVWFGGYQWVIIGWDGEGVASEADTDTDTATLLYANANTDKPIGEFDNHGTSNTYADSDLRTAMTSFYNDLSAKERGYITPRSLSGNSGDFPLYTPTGGSIATTSFAAAAGTLSASQYITEMSIGDTETFDWYAYDNLRRNGDIGGAQYIGTYRPDNAAGDDATLTDEFLWPLSVAEASLLDNTIRTYSDNWWLRSPGINDYYAAVVSSAGTVDACGYPVRDGNRRAIRPAFNLDLSSVIFTSAASGGKSDAIVGSGLVGASAPTGEIKLTVKDRGQNLDVYGLASGAGTDTLTFSYDDFTATTGTNQYISCVLEQGGAVKYYGKLEDLGSSASGSVNVPLTGVANGNYTLKIFSEQANGDNYTDYASEPFCMDITVSANEGTPQDQTPPTVSNVLPSGTGVALSGNVEITFDKSMNTMVEMGTVSLNGTPMTGASWNSTNTVYTIPYSGLAYGTAYAIEVSGFQDVAGNVIIAASSHSFTTTSSSSGSSGGGGVSTYTVTFDSKEGSAVSKYTGVTYGNTIKIPADPTKSGYTFAGWYKDDTTFNTPWDFTTDKVTSNITLYAKWTSDSSPVPVLNGWVKAGDDYYYYKEGVKVTSSWITTKAGNKYYVGANGKMAKSKWITTKYGNKYYVQANGRMARSKWITTKAGNKYYVQANGRMARSKWITTKYGNQYYVDANGRMTKKK